MRWADMLYLATREGDVIRDIAQRSGVAGDVAEKIYLLLLCVLFQVYGLWRTALYLDNVDMKSKTLCVGDILTAALCLVIRKKCLVQV